MGYKLKKQVITANTERMKVKERWDTLNKHRRSKETFWDRYIDKLIILDCLCVRECVCVWVCLYRRVFVDLCMCIFLWMRLYSYEFLSLFLSLSLSETFLYTSFYKRFSNTYGLMCEVNIYLTTRYDVTQGQFLSRLPLVWI